VDLRDNRLTFVDGEIFVAFPMMQNVNLKKNYCIDEHHHGKIGHGELVRCGS
jgi:hypothetical protein